MSQEAALSTGGRRRGSRRSPPVPEVGPGTDVGSYLVEARLGAGGFGTVFRARRGGQLYAVKLVSLAEVGEWGVREVLALSRVNHPNVAGLRGFWRWPEGAPHFLVVVMQYVEGRRLDEWAREENPSALQVLRQVLGVARALEAVHQARVVHLDVKPPNLLVREENGEPVLVDFGVSGWEETSGMTGYVMPPGTPNYRSPEAWHFQHESRGEAGARYQPTAADDLYALGVVLYWLLTDRVPFFVERPEDEREVVTRAPVPPNERNARVPLELSELCLRLLDKRPEARPDARAVREQAEPWLTRRGAAWEQPLCEAFSVSNQTTRPGPGADEVAWWLKSMKVGAERPRRGRKPQQEVESGPAAPGPAALPAPAPNVAPARGTPARKHRRVLAAGLGLVVALGALAFLFSDSTRRIAPAARAEPHSGLAPALPTWENGWKIAPPLKPPEAERPPVAPAAAPEEEDASVKSPQQKKPKGLGAVKKAAVMGCTTLACSSPQVLPPPPEPCPPGALEAMAQFGIRPGHEGNAVLGEHGGQWIKVNPGSNQVLITFPMRGLPANTWLSGPPLILGERVYGRLTQARTPDGKTYPVCIDLHEEGGPRGLDRRDDGKGSTAEVHATVTVVAVSRFK